MKDLILKYTQKHIPREELTEGILQAAEYSIKTRMGKDSSREVYFNQQLARITRDREFLRNFNDHLWVRKYAADIMDQLEMPGNLLPRQNELLLELRLYLKQWVKLMGDDPTWFRGQIVKYQRMLEQEKITPSVRVGVDGILLLLREQLWEIEAKGKTFSELQPVFLTAIQENQLADAEEMLNQLNDISEIELNSYQIALRGEYPALLKPLKEEEKGESMSEMGISSEDNILIVNAGLQKTDKRDNKWGGMVEGTAKVFGEMLDECARGLFGDEEAVINIGISSEKAGQFLPVISGKATLVRSKLDSRFRKYKLGKITINIFVDEMDEHGVNEGLNKLKEDLREMSGKMKGKTRTRVVTFMFSRDKEVAEDTYTVYLDGKQGETAVPVDACGMAGLAILNYFDRAEKAGGEGEMSLDVANAARLNIARGIAAISGRYDQKAADAIVGSIVENGILVSSGILLVKIRPIDTNEIVEYYEAAAEVIRSL